MQDHTITFFEACEFLNKSRKSVSRYIRKGLLHPQEIKSKQGTLEYRFTREDLENFKSRDQTGTDETTQDIPGVSPLVIGEVIREPKVIPPETGQDTSMIPFLIEQIKVKDKQIEVQNNQITQMIERDRETNILIHGLQEKILQIGPGETRPPETRQDETVPPEGSII